MPQGGDALPEAPERPRAQGPRDDASLTIQCNYSPYPVVVVATDREELAEASQTVVELGIRSPGRVAGAWLSDGRIDGTQEMTIGRMKALSAVSPA